MLPIILMILVTPIVVLIAVAAMKPGAFRVERRAIIQSSADTVFSSINDFHRWINWSPWEGLDPALNRTYSGSPAGKGAVYGWEGNKKVGSGRMEIVESVPSSRLVIKLDFLKPFEAHNTAEFLLAPASSGGTEVVWAMSGKQPFMLKVFGVLMPMDKLVGKDFEKGLANLKRVSEGVSA